MKYRAFKRADGKCRILDQDNWSNLKISASRRTVSHGDM